MFCVGCYRLYGVLWCSVLGVIDYMTYLGVLCWMFGERHKLYVLGIQGTGEGKTRHYEIVFFFLPQVTVTVLVSFSSLFYFLYRKFQ